MHVLWGLFNATESLKCYTREIRAENTERCGIDNHIFDVAGGIRREYVINKVILKTAWRRESIVFV